MENCFERIHLSAEFLDIVLHCDRATFQDHPDQVSQHGELHTSSFHLNGAC